MLQSASKPSSGQKQNPGQEPSWLLSQVAARKWNLQLSVLNSGTALGWLTPPAMNGAQNAMVSLTLFPTTQQLVVLVANAP